MFKRSLALLGAACLAAILAAAPASAQRTKLTLYTAIENDQLGPFKQAIEAAVPDVEVVWVRDSTGVITARFLAEKDNPRADVVFGLAVTSLIAVREGGPAGDLRAEGRRRAEAGVPRRRRRPTPGPAWTRILSVVCFNTVEGGKSNVADADLVEGPDQAPSYKGKIVMPHPASSGTGYLTIAAWLQIMGERPRPGSSWTRCTRTSRSTRIRARRRACRPPRASAWPASASTCAARARRARARRSRSCCRRKAPAGTWRRPSIVKGTKNLALAKKVADWGASKQASELYSKYYAIVAEPSVKNTPPNYPPTAEQAMVKNDFGWMAENRDRILAEWSKRYESKAAPKN